MVIKTPWLGKVAATLMAIALTLLLVAGVVDGVQPISQSMLLKVVWFVLCVGLLVAAWGFAIDSWRDRL